MVVIGKKSFNSNHKPIITNKLNQHLDNGHKIKINEKYFFCTNLVQSGKCRREKN